MQSKRNWKMNRMFLYRPRKITPNLKEKHLSPPDRKSTGMVNMRFLASFFAIDHLCLSFLRSGSADVIDSGLIQTYNTASFQYGT
jgi:hypothetical protein